ncbi:hypothetical protein BZL39_G00180 [Zygosaccharomyces parabailii]|nr:hypothetical protein BZL39_G00180 [Zygosaccharomyces parabailii]CDH13269.1 related to urea transporter (Dur3) [Zygosaccharomyces bailii ISA1307]
MYESGQFLIFSQGTGYGIIVGVGAFFAIAMVGISYLLGKYMNETQDSEMLSTAKRSIKMGLVASSVVSSWTIGATLLLSCTTTYNLGVAAAWWYGAGACVQIIIFAVASLELKRKVPNCHSFPEVIRVRYGTASHMTMCAYSFVQQLFYTANLLINGSSIFANITGMSRDASIVLLPLFVIIYTLLGGIKATFMTDWTHVVIIYTLMLMFLFKVYVTSDVLGSPSKVYDLLVLAAESSPVSGNKAGSLLTFTSYNSGLWGLILWCVGWNAACDSQLFQKAIAAHPTAVLGGYTIGGICWFVLPYALATTMGLAARALEMTPSFPTYPERLNAEQLGNGLVLPVSAYALMGRGGAGAILLMIFMACTAAFSSEIVAVGSIWTYDIYKPYVNKRADGKRLVLMTHLGVIGFSIATIVLAIGLSRAGFDVSFITTCMGIIVDPCIIPMGCTLFWKKMNGLSFVCSTVISTGIAIAVWLSYARATYGELTLDSLSTYKSLATGNTVALFTPMIFVPIFVYIKPANFDWEIWKRQITQVDDSQFDKAHGLTNVLSGKEATALINEEDENFDRYMKKRRNVGYAIVTFFVLFYMILFPLPLYGSGYIFSKTFFRGYIVVTFIWAFAAGAFLIIFPIAESYVGIFIFFHRIIGKKSVERKLYSDETIEHVTSIVSTKADREAARAKNNHTHDTEMDKVTYVTESEFLYHEPSSIDIDN